MLVARSAKYRLFMFEDEPRIELDRPRFSTQKRHCKISSIQPYPEGRDKFGG